MNKLDKKFCEKKIKQPDYYSEIGLHKLKSPITVLLGPNGTGKSMSLKIMREELKNYKCTNLFYSTRADDIVNNSNWDPYKLSCAFHSEGERMLDSFSDWCNNKLLPALWKESFYGFIFLDELDSGSSYDRLIEQVSLINLIAKNENTIKSGRVKFVVTCNSYEMLELFDKEISSFIWTPTKQKIKITSYNSFIKRYKEYYDYIKKLKGDD